MVPNPYEVNSYNGCGAFPMRNVRMELIDEEPCCLMEKGQLYKKRIKKDRVKEMTVLIITCSKRNFNITF